MSVIISGGGKRGHAPNHTKKKEKKLHTSNFRIITPVMLLFPAFRTLLNTSVAHFFTLQCCDMYSLVQLPPWRAPRGAWTSQAPSGSSRASQRGSRGDAWERVGRNAFEINIIIMMDKKEPQHPKQLPTLLQQPSSSVYL